MAEPSLKSLARRLCVLAVLVGASVVALSSADVPKADACVSCLSESRTAYLYCRDHPNDEYFGCNFSTPCDGGTRSANQIYSDECCWLAGGSLHCL